MNRLLQILTEPATWQWARVWLFLAFAVGTVIRVLLVA